MKIILLLFLPLALATPSFSKTTEEIRKEIQQIASQRHPSDTKEQWLAFGSEAPSIIIELLDDTKNNFRRSRLLRGLAWFTDDPDAMAYLRNVANETDKSVIRREIVSAIGRTNGEKEIDFLSKFLNHSDPHTRVAAANALMEIPENPRTAEIKSLVKQYHRDESVEWAKAKVEKRGIERFQAPDPPLRELLDSKFSGEWLGKKLGIDAKATKVAPFQIQWNWESDSTLKAIWSSKQKGEINQISGRGKNLRGSLQLKGQKVSHPIEISLRAIKGRTYLQIDVPSLGWVAQAVQKDLGSN